MLDALKFVMGAVSKKDLLPEMKHFAIEGKRVRSFNGRLALSSPIPFDIDCYPKAEMLYNAIANCEETVQLSMTPGGKLKVTSGAFKALVSCIEKSEVHLEPSGDRYPVDGSALLKAFKVLEPIIGEDASRPWATGILLRGKSAYATCNIVLVEYWTGFELPHVVNIPDSAVREVIRVNEPPEALQMDANSVTFHYPDGKWIRTQLLSHEAWPDLSRVLERTSNVSPVDTRIFDAMQKLKKFVGKDRKVTFTHGMVSTNQKEDDEGATIALEGSEMVGAYSLDMLMLLKDIAKQADFSDYPNPAMFFGDNLRGAIVGMVL